MSKLDIIGWHLHILIKVLYQEDECPLNDLYWIDVVENTNEILEDLIGEEQIC